MTFEQWSRQWAGKMAKMPHWTKRPGTPITVERARALSGLTPHQLRVLFASMCDDEIEHFMLYFKLGVIEREISG